MIHLLLFLAILGRRFRLPLLRDLPSQAAQRGAPRGAEHAAGGRDVPAQGGLGHVEELLPLEEAQAADLRAARARRYAP